MAAVLMDVQLNFIVTRIYSMLTLKNLSRVLRVVLGQVLI
jgi:hypothetical protein